MRISYVRIENFRNFKYCQVELGQNIVLVGENKVGKSNWIDALRLILDPSLSDLDRSLTEHDFWDGDEPFKGREIRVCVRFTDFADDTNTDYLPLSLFSDNCIVRSVPQPVAQLTYLYYNSKQLDNPTEARIDDYEFKVYPGDNPDIAFKTVELRKHIPLQAIGALRDIASDNRVWHRSPLSRLVELTDLKEQQLEPFAEQIRGISDEVLKLQPLNTLESEIRSRLTQMVGELYTINPQLGLNATSVSSLEEALRLYVDGTKRRSLDRASLGLQNALYLTLLSLLVEKQEIKRSQRRERYIPIIALEEPEAHLHPHLQRLVFSDFLTRARQRRQPVIISTHSPHLASVANIEDLVMLKDNGDDGCIATSAYDFVRRLDTRSRKDLDRFLDITKAELLFSKGVILVEGDAELILIGEFARILGTPLDRYGISVINVAGTYFGHVVTLANRFMVPFAVVTDGDKTRPVTGLKRGIDMISEVAVPSTHAKLVKKYEDGKTEQVRRYLRWVGIFVNEWTLEPELLDCGLHEEFKQVFTDLGEELGAEVQAGIKHIDTYLSGKTEENMKKVLASIADARWGKGRFAHRLVTHIRDKAGTLTTQEQKELIVPEYIRSAIKCLIGKVDASRRSL